VKSQLSCCFPQLRFPPNSCKTLSIPLRRSPVNNQELITGKLQDTRFSFSSLPLPMTGSSRPSSHRSCTYWGRNLSPPRRSAFAPQRISTVTFHSCENENLQKGHDQTQEPTVTARKREGPGSLSCVACSLYRAKEQRARAIRDTDREFKCDESQDSPGGSTEVTVKSSNPPSIFPVLLLLPTPQFPICTTKIMTLPSLVKTRRCTHKSTVTEVSHASGFYSLLCCVTFNNSC